MRSNAQRSWDRYNNEKERRAMQRAAELATRARTCEDCGGNGVDPGSLAEAEPCPPCGGTGVVAAPERAERKGMTTALAALPNPQNLSVQVKPTTEAL